MTTATTRLVICRVSADSADESAGRRRHVGNRGVAAQAPLLRGARTVDTGVILGVTPGGSDSIMRAIVGKLGRVPSPIGDADRLDALDLLSIQAPAGAGAATAQTESADDGLAAAVAAALPLSLAASMILRVAGHDEQSAKPLVRNVDYSGHWIASSSVLCDK